jgi:hypothetical protein
VNKLNKMPDRQRGAVLGTHASLLSGTNQKGDATIMRKHSRVIFFVVACLAGFMGQLAAFGATTNSVWNLTSVSTFRAGKIHVARTNAASAVFLSDGTCGLLIGADEFGGTYTNNTRQLKLTLGTGGVAALKSNAVVLIQAQVPSGVTITVKSVKFNKNITLKNGVPVKATDTISGKGCETVGTRTKCKSFSLKTLWTNWTLTSGTDF